MDKYIISENPLPTGVHEIHNASKTCEALPTSDQSMLIGYFATSDLAYKRARMNWPTSKVKCCEQCCTAEEAK
jgi:hypothetical protein